MSELHGDMASTTSRKTTSDISPSAYAMSTTVERSAECVLAVLSSNTMLPPYGRSISSPSGTISSSSNGGGSGGSSSPKKQHNPSQIHHLQHHHHHHQQSAHGHGHGYGSGSASHPSLMSSFSPSTASPTSSRKSFPGATLTNSCSNISNPSATMGTGTASSISTTTSSATTTPTDQYSQIFQDNHEAIDNEYGQDHIYEKDTVDSPEDDYVENENDDYCDEGQSISEDRSLTDSIPDSFHTPSASIQNLNVSSQKLPSSATLNTINNSANINVVSQNNSARSSVRSTSSKSGSGSDSGHSNSGGDLGESRDRGNNHHSLTSSSGGTGIINSSSGGGSTNGSANGSSASSKTDSTEKLKIPKELSPKSRKDQRDSNNAPSSIGSPENPQQSKQTSCELPLPLTNLHTELSLSTESNVSKDSSGSSSGKESKETVYVSPHYAPKPNKKKMWYHVFYPSYKTRSGDFKKIFKDLPVEERLIVDYSCALQREILVQGRMYVSQNYISFYANIFGWETQTSIRFKDITSITKEKTALVIPNAVQVSTETEKFFFTSFVTRDATYVMLFKLWQSSLLEDTLPTKEIWKLVHSCYGEELGVASEEDTEEFLACAPGYLVNAPSVSTLVSNSDADDSKSITEIDAQVCASEIGAGLALPVGTVLATAGDDADVYLSATDPIPLISGPTSDISDTSDSDVEIDADPIIIHGSGLVGDVGIGVEIPLCPVPHAVGKEVVSSVIPTDVDTLFTMLFTNSKFFLDLHTARKTFDIVQSEWQQSADGSQKVRQVSFTVTLNHVMGPKHSQVTESQVMLPVSKPGRMYAIDAESVNAGIPYADSFYVTTHYCLSRLSPNETKLCIVNQIKYKKFVWKLTKGFIEKNTWAGLEEFYTYLERALQEECGKINLSNQSPPNSPEITSSTIPIGRTESTGRTKIKRIAPNPPGIPRTATMPLPIAVLPNGSIATAKVPTVRSVGDSGVTVSAGSQTTAESSVVLRIILAVLACLLLLNAFLYVKLTRFETTKSHLLFPSQPIAFPKNVPRNHQEWVALLQQQEDLHRLELQKWHEILISALKILHQAEEDLESLKFHITSYGSGKFTIDSLKEAIDVMQSSSSTVPNQQHAVDSGISIGEGLLDEHSNKKGGVIMNSISVEHRGQNLHENGARTGTGSTNYPEEATKAESEIPSSTNEDANDNSRSEQSQTRVGESKESVEHINNNYNKDEL